MRERLARGEIEIQPSGGVFVRRHARRSWAVDTECLLFTGIAEGMRLCRPVVKDCVLTLGDVNLPQKSLACQLSAEQDALIAPAEAGYSGRYRPDGELR
jgi:predicted homoserine dehydrogenase-like protein